MTQRRFEVIDANPRFGAMLTGFLLGQGIRAELRSAAEPVLASLAHTPPRMVVLADNGEAEAALPTLHSIRALSRVPCVVLGRGVNTASTACLLDAGADDLIDRDVPLPTMLARMRAVLRRADWGPAESTAPRGWQLLLRRRQLLRPDGSECHLSTGEFALLRMLATVRPAAVSRETISTEVCRQAYRAEARTVDNLVLRLRRRLGEEQDGAIKTVRSSGYMFAGFRDADFEVVG